MRPLSKVEGSRILITGGACCLASHLVERLASERPARIALADNYSTGTPMNVSYARDAWPELVFHEADLSHERPLNGIVREERPDIVLNMVTLPLMASYDGPVRVWENNTKALQGLLELQRQEKYKLLVHISSSEAYGNMRANWVDEEHPLNPSTVYGASKAAEDILVQSYDRMYGLDYLIPRPFNFYGPRQQWGTHGPVIPRIVRALIEGRPPVLYEPGTQSRDYTYVGDVADAIVQLMKQSKALKQVVNICSGRAITIRYLIHLVSEALGLHMEPKLEPNPRPNDVQHLRGCPLRLKALAEWRPASIEDRVGETAEWYRELFEVRNHWAKPVLIGTSPAST